ncbi:MAG: M1 family metallopeptidase [Pyrinomonadaceae bacterium]
MASRFLISIALLLFACLALTAQDDKKVLAEVTVNATDPLYVEIRGASSAGDAFSGAYATVNNLVLKKDAASFTLQSGAVYFLKPAGGRVTGAVFIGSGIFSLVPPVEAEKKHLAIFVDSQEINENFSSLVIFFTDDTFERIKASPAATMSSGGSDAEKARSMFRDRESTLRKSFRYNMTSRILSDFYAPKRPGFFSAFIEGAKYGKLVYGIDPLGHADVYPEQVELLSYGETTGGIWAAFHMEEEYKKGTATSWQDRRTYDIKNHKIDVTIDGTRLVATDELTLEMREADSRFLPFDLFRSLRVKSVTDESGNALTFIQEDKDEDADFGVVLPAAHEVGKLFKIQVEYDGTDALREAGTGNFILIPRSTWYPNNPISSFGDRAAFDITFRWPSKFVLVGVGSPVGTEKEEGGLKVAKWSSNGIELAVAGFNYGNFVVKDAKDEPTGLTLEVYANKVLPDDIRFLQSQIEQAERMGVRTGTTLGSLNTAGMATTVLTEAQNAMRIYTNYFGSIPYKRLAMTQQPAGNFGQAWPTLVYMPYIAFFDTTHRVQLFGTRGGTDGFWREVAAHEVAHQWWGHTVGWTSYRDQWMSEGFSEFSTSLFIQYVKKDLDKFNEFWDEQRKRILEPTSATKGKKPYTIGPVTQGYRLNSAKTGAVAQRMIYPKGAYIMHMIRMMMFDHRQGTGDARFQKMIREFLASHYNKDVSTNDFKLAVEKHMLPSMDLRGTKTMDWFFDSWVYGTDIPSYQLTWSTANLEGKTALNAKLTQSDVSEDFSASVPLYLDFGKGPIFLGAARVTGNSSVELKNIQLPDRPKKLMIGAYSDILAEKIDIEKQ